MARKSRNNTNIPQYRSIRELTDLNAGSIPDQLTVGLDWIASTFCARITVLDWDGMAVNLGPDYRTRIAGVLYLLNLCTGARGSLASTTPRVPRMNYPDLLRIIAEGDEIERRAKEGPTPPRPAEPARRMRTRPDPSRPFNIADFADEQWERIGELFSAGLDSLRGVFDARKKRLDRFGDVVDVGPEYEFGMAAQKLYAELLTRRRQAPPRQQAVEKPMTDQEFCDLSRAEDEVEAEMNQNGN